MEEHNQTQHSGIALPPLPLPPPPPPTPPESHEIIIAPNNNNNNTLQLQSPPPPPPPPPPPSFLPQPQPPAPQLQSQGSRIVQIPLDQVYRVLPYNNHNNHPQNNNNHRSSHDISDQNSDSSSHHGSCFSSSLCLRFLLILTISIVLLVMIACIFYLALNPRSPRFFIENLTLKYPSSQDSSSNYNNYRLIRYNVSVEANNPNSHLGFYYLEGGSASLSYKKQEIANGKPPQFYNGKKDKRVFYLLLNSSSKALPKEFAEIIMKGDDKYSKVKMPLVVLIRAPMKIKLGKLKLWKMRMKITCDVSIPVSSKNNVGLGPQRCKNTIH